MIIARTPFRISFFGGGTDYPVWFEQYGGSVLSASIDKYCYLTCRYLPPFFEHRTRVVWSRIESVMHVDEIQHPAVREALKFMDVSQGVEIHHDADLPARSGLGSSSSFSVALLQALYALKGKMATKHQLALDAIHLEKDLLHEHVGVQDQTIAAYGGFNRIDFGPHMSISVSPMTLPAPRVQALQDHLMLFFTGFSRTASEIAKEQVAKTPERVSELTRMKEMVDEAIAILEHGDQLEDFGRLLHEAWKLKRSLTTRISNSQIDEIYEAGRAAGAYGGKLLGAGGGGFILFFVDPSRQADVRAALKDLLYVPVRFEHFGSQIIHYSLPISYA
jgi:D-glycero-alpha-D-manno-heptose-7-phosphate kinase